MRTFLLIFQPYPPAKDYFLHNFWLSNFSVHFEVNLEICWKITEKETIIMQTWYIKVSYKHQIRNFVISCLYKNITWQSETKFNEINLFVKRCLRICGTPRSNPFLFLSKKLAASSCWREYSSTHTHFTFVLLFWIVPRIRTFSEDSCSQSFTK